MSETPTPKALTDAGWVFWKKCTCGGILKYKYTHPQKKGMELHWLINYQQFKVYDKGRVKIPATKIGKLAEKLALI